jgi:hypothetical protein
MHSISILLKKVYVNFACMIKFKFFRKNIKIPINGDHQGEKCITIKNGLKMGDNF